MAYYGTNFNTHLRDEYERCQTDYASQPTLIQHFIAAQGKTLAEALLNNTPKINISLPNQIVAKTPLSGQPAIMLIPTEQRKHTIGGFPLRFNQKSLLDDVKRKIYQLENSPDQAVNVSARLIHYAAALHLVHQILPAGRSVTYHSAPGEDIPTEPAERPDEPAAAITSASDAIAESSPTAAESQSLQVPFVPAARRFYIPQWVAFDGNGRLLAGSTLEAETCLESMKRYINILHLASSLAPYITSDEEYQKKRYGMLGQIINQGRALALHKAEKIIKTVFERALYGKLNRGLSLDMPYYNDQDLDMAEQRIEIIPAGRIPFKPAFIVRAARLERARISQDTRLNKSTKKYLLQEIDLLEKAFKNYSLIEFSQRSGTK